MSRKAPDPVQVIGALTTMSPAPGVWTPVQRALAAALTGSAVFLALGLAVVIVALRRPAPVVIPAPALDEPEVGLELAA